VGKNNRRSNRKGEEAGIRDINISEGPFALNLKTRDGMRKVEWENACFRKLKYFWEGLFTLSLKKQ